MLARKSKKVLVLGERVSALTIAQEFEKLGCISILQADHSPLPRLSHRDSITQMREVLAWFYRESEGDGLVHPGVSPWADRAELQTLGHELGLTVIGPSARVLSLCSNKLSLMLQAEQLGVPTLVLSDDPIHSVREIHEFFSKSPTGFPFWIRSARGSGHWSRFLIQNSDISTHELEVWIEQLRWNLGEVILFPERCVDLARHVLVPFVRYESGEVELLPCVDVSLQCRNRKILEFCSEAWPEPTELEQLRKVTSCLAEQMGIVGVGTFEFALNASTAQLPYLIDAQARLNTGYLLWQGVSDVSAIALQLAAQGLLGVKRPVVKTHSRSLRPWAYGAAMKIYAEDSIHWIPQVGQMTELGSAVVATPGDSACVISEGGVAQCSEQDSGLLAVVHLFSHHLSRLMELGPQILEQMWISGTVQTNQRMLSELFAHPWVKQQVFHLRFIQEDFIPLCEPPDAVVLLACGVCRQLLGVQPLPSLWKVGERWVRAAQLPSDLGLVLEGQPVRAAATQVGQRWMVRIGQWFLWVCPYWETAKKQKGVSPQLFSQMTGRVHALLFRPLGFVPRGVPLIWIECSGVLVPHSYPVDVLVKEWKVRADERVEAGQLLAILGLTS